MPLLSLAISLSLSQSLFFSLSISLALILCRFMSLSVCMFIFIVFPAGPLSMTPGTTPCCPDVHGTWPHQGLYVGSIPTLSHWGPLPLFVRSLLRPLPAKIAAHPCLHLGCTRSRNPVHCARCVEGEADPSRPSSSPTFSFWTPLQGCSNMNDAIFFCAGLHGPTQAHGCNHSDFGSRPIRAHGCNRCCQLYPKI